MLYRGTKLSAIKDDITRVRTDAIVNAANNSLLGGSGVDGAIHKAGGPLILEQCKKIGGCPTGEARITVGGNLPADYVIHTVGPIYIDGNNKEDSFLYRSYYNSLKLGMEYGIRSISFPAISTGVYGYPKEEAMKIALEAVRDFIDVNQYYREIIFVLYSESDYNMYRKYLEDLSISLQ